MTPARSPLGAFYRSPLGVRGGFGLYGWGYNHGTGVLNESRPSLMSAIKCDAVAAGDLCSFVLSGGHIYSVGQCYHGELGIGVSFTFRSALQDLGGGWAKCSAREYAAFGIKTNGDLYAWGQNESGELGNGGVGSTQLTPYLVGAGWDDVSAGHGNTLALRGTTLYGWGDGSETGNNWTGLDYGNSPTPVDSAVTKVAAGGTFHALLKGDALYTWGDNSYGQLGQGDTTRRETPTLVSDGWKDVSSGTWHGLGIKNNGDLYAWGENWAGEIGDGTTNNQRDYPVKVGENFRNVFAGWSRSFAVDVSGRLWSWGWNSDKNTLGRDNSVFAYTVPGLVGFPFSRVASGYLHAVGAGFLPIRLA